MKQPTYWNCGGARFASTVKRETGKIGFEKTSAKAFAVVKPTRTPVKEPGPEATA